MTNEFAIKVLNELRSYGDKFANIGFDRKEALDMAINALEQQPCEDAISREAVLDEIDKYIKKAQSTGIKDDFISFEELVVKQLPSVTPKAEWIPCSEKMPDINIHVLAQFVMGGMAECYYAHNWWHIVGGVRISGDEVIAWQPLPELYKAESEETE